GRLPPLVTPTAVPRAEPFPSARTRSSLKPLIVCGPTAWLVASPVLDLQFRHRRQPHAPPLRSLMAAKERIGKRDHPRMMQLVVRKQNGCQKCVAQLDTKANERKGSPRFRNGRHNLLAHHWGDISLGSVRATLQLESEVRNRVAVLQDFGLPGLNGLAQAPLDPLIEGLGRSSLPGQV